jgi:plastocyanin
MTRLLRLLGAAAAAAVLVAACGGGNDETTASGGATTTAPSPAAATTGAPAASATTTAGGGGGTAADSGTITIKDFQFGEPLTVKPGATITVVNQDVPRHDVVADQGNMFKTPLLGQGEKATFNAPTAPGTYTFSCSVHANMTGIGTLVVKG